MIKPGMSFKEVKAALISHGYEVDAKKYGLAMASEDEDIELDFCPIDSDIVLVISYKLSTAKVVSLDVYFFPTKPVPKIYRVPSRRARKIIFDEEDAFTATLERVLEKPKRPEREENADDPFGS